MVGERGRRFFLEHTRAAFGRQGVADRLVERARRIKAHARDLLLVEARVHDRGTAATLRFAHDELPAIDFVKALVDERIALIEAEAAAKKAKPGTARGISR